VCAGATGIAVALRAKMFGFAVHFYDPFLADGVEKSLGVGRWSTLHELLQLSDCVSLHCPLNGDTRRLLDDFALRQLKPGALLVNTASAALVDARALLAALRERRLAGAAVDSLDGDLAELLRASRSGQTCYTLL